MHKPLRKGLKVVMTDKEIGPLVKYEILPSFSYNCGLLGHNLEDCDRVTEQVGKPTTN